MRRWLIAAVPLVVLIAVAYLFASYALRKSDTRVEPDFTVGKPAPAMMLPYLEGGPPVDVLAEIKGPALVNIFASWCIPCAVEAPYLARMHDQGVRIIGLDQGQKGERDPPADIAEFLTRYGNPYAAIFNDEKQRGLIDYGATGVPESFVIDSRGVIVAKKTGPIESDEDMNRLLAALRAAR